MTVSLDNNVGHGNLLIVFLQAKNHLPPTYFHGTIQPMKASQIAEILEARVHTCIEKLDIELKSACGADLMSDVMAFVKEDVVLLTGLLTTQSVRTASLLDIPVVVYVRGKVPGPDMIQLATENAVILMTTRYSMFIACGRLYEQGLKLGGTREID
jgi:hypothetical protein